MTPVIRVRDLSKIYRDGTHAVNRVSFDVARGEVFGLLGPNGAGKTTTMRILGTLHSASSGRATVLGIDVAKHPHAVRERIGFAMQEVGMDDLATAEEMLRFHGRLYGLSRLEARRRTEELLESFQLGAHAGRRVTRFSGGMQRRLDLAVSLIHRPDVLFLDEPSTGLDPVSRADLWQVLRKLRADQGITILMSTHYMDEAEALCDRIAIMAGGHIRAIDTPAALRRSVGADRIEVQMRRALDLEETGRVERALGGHCRIIGNTIHVPVRDGGASLLPVLQRVAKARVTVASTRVVQPTLDDVFVKYTGDRLEAEAPA